ncbi:hypothetical protein TWF696_004744 [Orbilia brochopaga]|uniref:F-box domain-containing protein n=1 Tax=Orbilia brochopaga TaxID=3140254 RepID=A0AAV9V568_9PEZI
MHLVQPADAARTELKLKGRSPTPSSLSMTASSLASAATAAASAANAARPIVNLPQEILIHIAKQLPIILDVFVLRQTCKALYRRLGKENGNLWYHFLNNKNGSHWKRFSHYQQDADYFGLTRQILAGEVPGCQLCLRDVNTPVDAYRGSVFYKTLCRNCAKEHFTELWRLEDQYPSLQIHPNDTITWIGGFPFDDPAGVTGRWLGTDFSMTSVRNVDLRAAIIEQLGYDASPNAKDIWEARYDKQIRFALKKKESANVVVTVMTRLYRENFERLHWLQPPDAFSQYLYNALLWNIRPWLAPHYGDKSMPKFTLGDHMEDLLDLYTESEELAPSLRQHGLERACREALAKVLAKIPQPGQVVRRQSCASPLIRYWLDAWLRERGYKGIPASNRNLKNTSRVCPFCAPTGGKGVAFNCTIALAIHIWCRHEERMGDEWLWVPIGEVPPL